AQPARRNLVVYELRRREIARRDFRNADRIENVEARVREVAVAHRNRRDDRLAEALHALTQTFVVSHEEHAVLDDRPCYRKAELVTAERRTVQTAPAIGLDLVVAQELVHRAVKLVRSRLGGHRDLR